MTTTPERAVNKGYWMPECTQMRRTWRIEMDNNQWLDLGRGTGKRPEGVVDDTVVRQRLFDSNGRQWDWSPSRLALTAKWHHNYEYQALDPIIHPMTPAPQGDR